MKKAYGGVVIDLCGRVLLREPAGLCRGVAWTFAKGKPEGQESPEQTAVREVLEETGVRARVLLKIPGCFDGAHTSNEYFLMLPIEDTGKHDEETLALQWVDQGEAAALISETLKPRRRARDLQVLEIAFALFRSRFPTDIAKSEIRNPKSETQTLETSRPVGFRTLLL